MADAHTVIFRAKSIITMNDNAPRATAVAVQQGRIVAVGSEEEVIHQLAGDYIFNNDYQDKVILPGLIDQHLHPMLGATTLTTEIIAPEEWHMPRRVHPAASTAVEYDERLRDAHRRLPEGAWLFSWGYHSLWHGDMSRQRLDAIAPNRPVAIWQRSCHEWYLNSVALNTLELTDEKCSGHGLASSQIDYLRGHFWENGWMLTLAPYLMPIFMTRDRFREGLVQMVEYLHMNGVTAINEPGIYWRNEPWDLYQEILGAASTPFQSTFMVEGRTQPVRKLAPSEFVADAQKQVERGAGEKVFVVDKQVKLFADGAIISQLMQMNEPYLDREGRPDAHHHGEWMMEPEVLKTVFDAYWDAEWQPHIHVNGDKGLDVVLDVLEDAQKRFPRTDHRTVIVHFANSTEVQVDRIARLGAIVSANPYYPVGFADKFSEWGLGPDRADVMVRAASVLREGIPLSFHSDLPMCPSDPMMMASYAVNRTTPSGRVAGPEQRISVHDALRAVTIEAAFSWQRENELGSIEEGKIANFTVLDADPYDTDPTRLARIPIVATIFEGESFPIADDLVAQRSNSNYVIAQMSASEHVSGCIAHGCGCEVAEFIARHVDADGWAA
jgi:predicted amidohydrolase YtcJ